MLTMKKHEYVAIEDDQNTVHDEITYSIAEKSWKRRFYMLLSLTVLITVVTSALVVWFSLSMTCSVRRSNVNIPYTPAMSEVQYMNRHLTRDPDTPSFMGEPRPELDEAWHELLEGTLIKYSAEELKKAGNATSVAHKDGGYVGGLGISHSLHCLKRLKQYMYPEYYYSHENQDWKELESHADHCLESLRQTLLCQPDISVYTLEWTPHSRFKPTVRVPQAHMCVNWPKLHVWMKARAAKLEDMVPPDPSLYAKTEDV